MNDNVYENECVGRLEDTKLLRFFLLVLHKSKRNESNVVLCTTVTKLLCSLLLPVIRPKIIRKRLQ